MTTSLHHSRVDPQSPDPDFVLSRESARECTVPLYRFNQGGLVLRKDSIAVEGDLLIRIRNHPDMRLSRTPGDDLNLVLGHLFSNGILETPEDVVNVDFSYKGTAKAEVSLGFGRAIRRIFPRRPTVRLAPRQLFGLKEIFERRQNLFKHTGSTHAAALFSLHGELLSYGEDVGRHNAFDKAVGRALQEGTLGQVTIAMLSSRIAVDLASKAAIANIPVLCGFSAATSSGVEYAEKKRHHARRTPQGEIVRCLCQRLAHPGVDAAVQKSPRGLPENGGGHKAAPMNRRGAFSKDGAGL